MKGKTLSALGFVVLAVGIALMIFYTVVNSSNIVIGAGVAFTVVGVINLVLIASSRKSVSVARLLTQITNGGAIILGICMLVFTSTFSPLVPFIFGIVAAVCALWQFFMLAMGTEPYRLPGWLYVFPLTITGLAVWIFIARPHVNSDESLLTLLTGCSLALTGVGSIIEGSILGHERRKAERQAKQIESRPSEPAQPAADTAEHKAVSPADASDAKADSDYSKPENSEKQP